MPPLSPTTLSSEQIGLHVRAAREARGLSQLALARAIGQVGDQRKVRANAGSSYISRIENGRFPGIQLVTLQRIASALGVGLDDLILSPGGGKNANGKTKAKR